MIVRQWLSYAMQITLTLALAAPIDAEDLIHCPAYLPGTHHAVALSGNEIVAGDPNGFEILAPTSSEEQGAMVTNRWDLQPYNAAPIFLRCTYGQTRRVFRVPKYISICKAQGSLHGGRVALPMPIQCHWP